MIACKCGSAMVAGRSHIFPEVRVMHCSGCWRWWVFSRIRSPRRSRREGRRR